MYKIFTLSTVVLFLFSFDYVLEHNVTISSKAKTVIDIFSYVSFLINLKMGNKEEEIKSFFQNKKTQNNW